MEQEKLFYEEENEAKINALSALAETASSLSRAVNKIATYVPTQWVDNSEPSINATRLMHIENGIRDATAAVNNAIDAVTANSTAINKINSDFENIISKQSRHYGLVNYNESYDLAVQPMDDYTKNLITSVTIPAKTMGMLTVLFDNARLIRENGTHWITFNMGFYTTPGSDISLVNRALGQELEFRSGNNKTAYFSSQLLTYPIFNNESRDIVLNAYAYVHTSDNSDPIEGSVHYNFGIQFLGLNLLNTV